MTIKKIFLKLAWLLILFSSTQVSAQKETFDLVSYTPPKGWVKDAKTNMVTYTITNPQTNTWCQISIIKSTVSKGTIEKDFENEWQDLVVKNYKPTGQPELNPVVETDGWNIIAGSTMFNFNNQSAVVILTTASGFERCASIVVATNSQDYSKDIEGLLASVDLIKPEIKQSNTNDAPTSILGTWVISTTLNERTKDLVTNVMGYGYFTRQYSFNSNNTYSFVSKTFMSSHREIVLVKETGTYQINGNTITIMPEKNVMEEWSKKDSLDYAGRRTDVDEWGKLISSKNRAPEKTIYRFTHHYFSGIQIWNLVLQADQPTLRDGPFSNNTSFSNAWYYGPVSPNNPVITLPAGQQGVLEQLKNKPTQTNQPVSRSKIIGTWGVGTTVASATNMHMNEGSIITHYTFDSDGTYSFYRKTFRYQLDKLLLTRETGTYQLNGNQLTVNPQKSVIEAWSKKDGTDNWGKLLSSDQRELEKTTYSFSTEDYGLGMVLILKAGKETKRDGYFNNSGKDAWFYPAMKSVEFIKLP